MIQMTNTTLACLRSTILAAIVFTAAMLSAMGTAQAGEADIIDVQISRLGNDRYQIDVTVQHADEGWDHYANRWDVLGPDGELLGSRVLAHPHVNEQPFTRSLSITIASDIQEITLRANDSVDGIGGQTKTVPVPQQ